MMSISQRSTASRQVPLASEIVKKSSQPAEGKAPRVHRRTSAGPGARTRTSSPTSRRTPCHPASATLSSSVAIPRGASNRSVSGGSADTTRPSPSTTSATRRALTTTAKRRPLRCPLGPRHRHPSDDGRNGEARPQQIPPAHQREGAEDGQAHALLEGWTSEDPGREHRHKGDDRHEDRRPRGGQAPRGRHSSITSRTIGLVARSPT